MFYLHVEILNRGYHRVHPDIMVFTACFCMRDLRVFIELSAKIITNRLQTYFIQRRSCWAVRCSVCTVRIKWSVGTSECDSRWFLLIVRWIRGGHTTVTRRWFDESRCKRLQNPAENLFYPQGRISTCSRTIFIK